MVCRKLNKQQRLNLRAELHRASKMRYKRLIEQNLKPIDEKPFLSNAQRLLIAFGLIRN